MSRPRALHAVALTGVLALAAVLAVPATAAADPVAQVQEATERFTQKAVEQAAASCRRDPVGREECAELLGTADASAAAVAAYEGSETSRVLDLQRSWGDTLPLNAGLWIGTHNSANSTSEDPTLSQSDSNQQLSLTDQLRLDVRSLELDAHWWPSLRAGGYGPVLCHAQPAPTHTGCTTERLLSEGLAEVAAWLRTKGNEDEVVLLYLEDHLEGQEGHDRAVADLETAFGTLLYRPTSTGGCTQLPPSLTRDAIRSEPARVVVMTGGCDEQAGAAWHGAVFSETQRKESRPQGYGYPACGGYAPGATDGLFLRYFEDSTFVNAATTLAGQAEPDDGLTADTLRAMTKCGVDLLGLDQLVPGDGRLDALVWSFAPGQLDAPAGAFAVQRASDGRWEAVSGRDERLPAACLLPDGSWTVTGPGPRVSAEGRCEELGAVFAAPKRGRDAQRLLEAQLAAGAERVWLALESSGAGDWA